MRTNGYDWFEADESDPYGDYGDQEVVYLVAPAGKYTREQLMDLWNGEGLPDDVRRVEGHGLPEEMKID